MESKKQIGYLLKAAIERSPYSVAEIADKIGTSTQNLYKIFKKEDVGTKYLWQISDALNVPLSSLFFDAEELGRETDNYKNIKLFKLEQENNDIKEEVEQLKSQLSLMNRALPWAVLGEVLYYGFLESSENHFKIFDKYISFDDFKDYIYEHDFPKSVQDRAIELMDTMMWMKKK